MHSFSWTEKKKASCVVQCCSRRGRLRDVHDCVFFLKLLVKQCRITEPIAADQALLRNFRPGCYGFLYFFSVALLANVAVLTAVSRALRNSEDVLFSFEHQFSFLGLHCLFLGLCCLFLPWKNGLITRHTASDVLFRSKGISGGSTSSFGLRHFCSFFCSLSPPTVTFKLRKTAPMVKKSFVLHDELPKEKTRA